jgi:glycosyltransferase involved in cell wall biosynthesis
MWRDSPLQFPLCSINRRVAVVLPAYNAETTLLRTVAELDSGLIDEVVLVDDASTDTPARSRANSAWSLKDSGERNQGDASGRRIAARHRRYRWSRVGPPLGRPG